MEFPTRLEGDVTGRYTTSEPPGTRATRTMGHDDKRLIKLHIYH